MYIYIGDGHWRRFDLEALASRRQEVAFQQEMRRDRVNR